ncbi:substrate-binding domain-containing protein [Mucilaginibacter sp. 21P]|uniref:PstS family phosphate ABC transporter substrate-binding protein n=1 Tax=Mucilaginibacter sp. 21P TaxID=2778902 RepID=UPI001C585A1B|nr:substrate-binding domain-containing protein [Mucilaginibacter sp. 21P]QXV65917.1 substrate-binding domain-containing protein [Mucilaginibacter sp. 21P]
MKINTGLFICAIAVSLLSQGCGAGGDKKQDKKQLDGFVTGTANFSADESFSPIVNEELFVFRGIFRDANPVITYKPETGVISDLLNDKTRVAILSRTLDTTESGVLKRRELVPDVNKFAIDAVALIVNQASNDTTISVNEIKQMLRGEAKANKSIVFDNPNSSLVRYLKALAGTTEFKQKNIYALSSNKEVIKYVSTHTDAIGITGFSWLNDPDQDYAAAVDKVKIMGVKDESSKTAPNEYFKPSQTTLVEQSYPLSRSLYIIDCTGRKGLGAGFASFLASERGQRIILKSGLLPDSLPPREINIVH